MSKDCLLHNLRGMASPTAELAADRIETLEAEVAKIQRALGTRAIFAGCATDEDKVDAMGREIAHLERLAAGYCAEVDQCHEEAVTFQAEISSLRAALEEAQLKLDAAWEVARARGDSVAAFLNALDYLGGDVDGWHYAREVLDRMESAEREFAALKAQGACDSCEHFRLDVDMTTGADELFCALHAQQCAVFGGRCGMWAAKAPVAPTPEEPAPPSGAGKEEKP